MVQDYTIGLNETRLGISAPTFFQSAFRNVLSKREAEKALTLGTMFSTQEALKVRRLNYLSAKDNAKQIFCLFFRLDLLMKSQWTKLTRLQNVRISCFNSKTCPVWLVHLRNRAYVEKTWKSWTIIVNKICNCFCLQSISRSYRKVWELIYKV